MAATAIAHRMPLALRAARARASAGGLAFDELGGPVVAVCGLTGGAGTTTLALLLARHAAAASRAPILLSEADPRHAGLTALAGRATAHPLPDLAQQIALDTPPKEAFVELQPGLRLVAATPRRRAPAGSHAMRALLGEARAAHGLVIVDCATTWTPDSPTLTAATHILWATAATPAGLTRARALLESDVMPAPGRMVELLVATGLQPRSRVSVRSLRRLAAQRCERLILIPHSTIAARGEPSADAGVAHALSGLAVTLRRTA